MDRGYPQTLIENLLSEIKIYKRESKLLKQNNKEEKEILQVPTLSVYYKGSLNNKNGILYKTNHNFNKFLKNHQSFPYKKGKSLEDVLIRAKKKVNKGFHACIDVRPVTLCIFWGPARVNSDKRKVAQRVKWNLIQNQL